MYTTRVLVLFTIAVALAIGQASSGFAGETATMTNAVIVEMFEAGLSAEVIITQIEQASNTNFDLETSSLIALGNSGIRSEVIAAMQRTNQRSNPPEVSPLPQRLSYQQRMALARRSVALSTEGERHYMYAAKIAGMKYTGGAWVPFVPTKTKTKLAGSHARLRVEDSTPVFEVSINPDSHPEDSILLVKVKVKKDVRLITTSKSRGLGNTNLIPQEDRVPLRFDPIPTASALEGYQQKFRAIVEKPLESGEYVIVVDHRYFDFGIDL